MAKLFGRLWVEKGRPLARPQVLLARGPPHYLRERLLRLAPPRQFRRLRPPPCRLRCQVPPRGPPIPSHSRSSTGRGAARDANPPLTVSQLLLKVRRRLEPEFASLSVAGEISELKKSGRSGYYYFTLKDSGGQVQCTAAPSLIQRLKFPFEAGIKVVVGGQLRLYEARGALQLVVQSLRLDGLGQFHLAFEALKKRLLAEGLFEDGRKRLLPVFPHRVLLVTSMEGAVYHDLMTTFRQRNPCVVLCFCHIPVQGERAADQIVEKLSKIEKWLHNFDAMVLARGGGSIEDLWPFNSERLVRYLQQFPIPWVSAIGHESDFTLCDFVADKRAATPTAAATLLAPERRVQLDALDVLRSRLTRAAELRLKSQRHLLEQFQSRLRLLPQRRIETESLRLSGLRRQLQQALQGCLGARRQRLDETRVRLVAASPRNQAERQRRHLSHLFARLDRAFVAMQERRKRLVEGLSSKLQALSPLRVLDRGYSICFDDDGRLIRTAEDLAVGQGVRLQFQRGLARARIEELQSEQQRASGMQDVTNQDMTDTADMPMGEGTVS